MNPSQSHDIAIPERFDVYQQDLTVPYLKLIPLGHVRNAEEARSVCAAFMQQDREEVKAGRHTYIFMCTKMKGEDSSGDHSS